MIVCPVQNKEWKNFVKNVGSKEEAYKQWIANGYKIPEVAITTRDRNRSFSTIVKNNKLLIRSFEQQMHENRSKIKESTDKTIRKNLNLQNFELEKRIEELKKNNVAIENVTIDPRDVVNFGLSQLEEVSNFLSGNTVDLKSIQRYTTTIKMWQKFSDVSDDSLFFSKKRLEEMMKDPSFKSNMANLRQQADLLSYKMFDLGLKLFEEKILTSQFEDTVKKETIKRIREALSEGMKDINTFSSLFLSIDYYDNVFFKVLSEYNTKATFESNIELEELFKRLDEAIGELTEEQLNLFKQKHSNNDSRQTGDLVMRTTQAWFDKTLVVRNVFRERENAARRLSDSKKDEALNKAYNSMLKEYSNIAHVIDLKQLFSEDQKEREEYESYLRSLAGEKGLEFYKKEAKKKFDEYNKDSGDVLEWFRMLDPTTAEQYHKNWMLNNNPLNTAIYVNKGVSEKGFHPRPRFYYTQMIPKNPEDYDNNFKQIENDPKLLAAHNFLIETIDRLKTYLPSEEARKIHMNTIPDVAKDMLEKFMEDGTLKTASALYDKLIESTRTPDIGSTIDSVELEVTGKQRKSFQFPLLTEHRAEVNAYIKFKRIEYTRERAAWVEEPKDYKEKQLRRQQRNFEIINMIPEWRAEKLNEIAQQKSWDLKKVFRVMGSIALTYKHRSKVEDSVRMVESIMDKVKEVVTNPAGEILKNSSADVLRKQGLSKQMESFNYWEDIFFGYPARSPEGVTTKKVLNSEEKELKKKYEDEITNLSLEYEKGNLNQEEFNAALTTLYTQIDELGGYRTWSAIGDDLLAYMQLKGIGWNVFSAFSNLGFGLVSNITEAADGRRFTMKEMLRAIAMSLNSVGRSTSFGMYETSLAKKIHNLMDKLDVLKEARFEVYGSRKYKLKEGFDSIMPYNLQQRTEFINQSTVMIAMMLHKKVKIGDQEMSLFEAYDNDGNLSEELRDTEINMKSAIDEAIRDIHGNYDNLNHAIRAKKHFFGRAFVQFKTWALMGFHNRFSGDDYSQSLGIVKRGRYKSYVNLYKELGPMKGTFEITKQLLRKLAGNTTFDEIGGQFDEVDAANMRKNLQEIVIYMSLMGIALLLKNMLADDDDEPKDLKFATIFLLNATNRLGTDIMFYTNPIEFQKLSRQVIPLFQLVTDASRLINHMGELIIGETDLYTTGIYAGESKTWRYSKSLIPFLTTFNRVETMTKSQVWK